MNDGLHRYVKLNHYLGVEWLIERWFLHMGGL